MGYDCLNIIKWTEAKLKYTYDVSLQQANAQELHEALGEAVMMAISDRWNHAKHTRMPDRKAYYISAEYLIGRLVYANLYNMGILEEMQQLFAQRGVDLSVLEDIEDAALGNGGLGRLAACFLDSAASLNLPLSGYGLRYRFGLFKQSFDPDGGQRENADDQIGYSRPLADAGHCLSIAGGHDGICLHALPLCPVGFHGYITPVEHAAAAQQKAHG